MPDQLQLRGGTTVQHSTFTGSSKEVTVDTTKKTAVVHDGSTVGGNPLMREDASNSALALGSAAAPSLKFTGDTNTGIYSPGADQVAVSTGGTGRLFVNSNGDIGLGTSSPDPFARFYTRNIGLSSSGSTSLQINAATGSNAIIDLGVNSARTAGITSNVSETQFTTLTATPIIVGTNGGERVRITSAGLVGIGTSAPSERLTVAGNIDLPNVNSYIKGGGHNVVQVDATRTYLYGGTNGIQVRSADNLAELINITNAGLVGIGTTTVDALLEVYSPTSGANLAKFSDAFNNRCLIVKGASGGVNLIAAEETNEASTGYGIAFSRGATEMGRFDGSGRLLVGTSSSITNLYRSFNGAAPPVQIETATDNYNAGVSALNYSASGFPPVATLGMSRSSTKGTNTVVVNGDELGYLQFVGADGTNFRTAAWIRGEVDGTPGSNDMPGRLVFSTTADGASSPTERMRITSGIDLVGISSPDGSHSLIVYNGTSAGTGLALFIGKYGSSAPYTGGTNSIIIWTNGNVVNTNNSYGALSDIKLKENVVDANSQWDDLKALQVRNYNFKEGQTHTQIGLVAQEVELVSPGLVSESPDRDEEGNDLGTVTKSVNYSVLYMKAVKALQEAMERIEQLEQRLTDAGIA
jgi:hypothetical protein